MSLPIEDRRRAWRLLFHGDAARDRPTDLGQVVLDELRAYCFGGFSTEARDNAGRVDPSAVLIGEGRRQVLLMVEARLREPAKMKVDDDEDE